MTRRARPSRTTEPDRSHPRAADLVDGDFGAQHPDQLWVADFTYVPMEPGWFGYTAFIIDAFSGLIVGWECSAVKDTGFVESTIRQAAAFRRRQGRPLPGNTVHHSDAGWQYTPIRFGETLQLAALVPSVGSVADALDNALAETTIGLYKTECTRYDSPFRTGPLRSIADLEAITAAWVYWYKSQRIMHRLGRRSPAEAEADYHAHNPDGLPAVHT